MAERGAERGAEQGEEQVVDDDGKTAKRSAKPRRWGLLTLGFLSIALASVITANMLAADGGEGSPLTGVGVLVGFGGAAYCSYRGIRAFSWLPRD